MTYKANSGQARKDGTLSGVYPEDRILLMDFQKCQGLIRSDLQQFGMLMIGYEEKRLEWGKENGLNREQTRLDY